MPLVLTARASLRGASVLAGKPSGACDRGWTAETGAAACTSGSEPVLLPATARIRPRPMWKRVFNPRTMLPIEDSGPGLLVANFDVSEVPLAILRGLVRFRHTERFFSRVNPVHSSAKLSGYGTCESG